MKKHVNLWLVMFLAISLALPIYSMAQTTKLTLESSSGDRIWGANVKTFSLGADNTLVIYLDGPFDFRALYPDISVDDTSGTYAYCTVSSPASVTANQGVTLSFKLKSLTANAQFSPIVVNPEDGIATFDTSTKVFTWPTGGSSSPVPTGSYLAVFEATVGADKSQLVVMIKINPPETVTAPSFSGQSTGTTGISYQFTATGSTSSLNHAIEYQFDWGDGNQSGWSASPQSHSWATASTTPYNIKAKARCVPDHVESAWSGTSSITISDAPPQTHTLTVNVSPSSSAGTVSLNPSGGSYTAGTQVTLTANPSSNYTFSSWSGVDSSSGTTASVTMGSTNKAVTANFTTSGGGVVYTKLKSIVPLSGDFYGLGADSYAAGQTKTYTLPLGEVYPGKNLKKLYVTTIASIDGQGDVDIKLTSPDGSWSMVSASAFADEAVTVASQKWPQQPNYPADYLDSGNWTLEITGKTASVIKIWWKCYY